MSGDCSRVDRGNQDSLVITGTTRSTIINRDRGDDTWFLVKSMEVGDNDGKCFLLPGRFKNNLFEGWTNF